MMPGRNLPCPCGSGKKYKRCHGKAEGRDEIHEPRLILDRATQLARAGQLDQALNLAGKLPSSSVKFQFQIDLLKDRQKPGDLQQAEKKCVQWQRVEPRSVQPLFQLMQIYWGSDRSKLTPSLAVKIGKLEPGHQLTPYYQAISQQLSGDLPAAILNHRLALLRNGRHSFSELELDLEVGIAVYDVAAGHYPGSPGLNETALVEAQSTYDLLNHAIQCWLDSKPDFSRLRAGQITRYGNACYNLGCAQADRYDRLEGALQHFQNALQVDPGHTLAQTNSLFAQNYDPHLSNRDALCNHREVAAEFRRRIGPPKSSWKNNPEPERTLRIAYLSSDFCRHSVAHFITPVLEAHEQESLQLHAYHTGQRHDEWTERIESAVHQLNRVGDMTDQELHRRIVQDRIDILIDLNGFSRGHRVDVLMQRAAPIQVSWIGYPNTTGLDVMDYRIVDRITDPEPDAKNYNSESLITMDPVFSVYMPNPSLPDVAPETPAVKAGYFTFGSFNALPKLNPGLFNLWAQILSQVDGSKLLLKTTMLDQPSVRRDVSDALSQAGIEVDRQILLGRTPSPQEHMQTYNQVDLCLDSTPYNGTTTSCDTLTMGVPVVTLAGSRHVSRVTASQLYSMGLDILVASHSDQYVDTAVRLASDMSKLSNLRAGLRERIQKSPLMDYRGFTRQLEKKYRDIWRLWCADPVNKNHS
jgi:predicted O-linked N-acetylglucosamine transferase (SPINDLY family)